MGQEVGWQLRAHYWLLHPLRSGQTKPVQRMLALVTWQVANSLGYLWQMLVDLGPRQRGVTDSGGS